MVLFIEGGIEMKKWYVIFVASLLLILTACGGETNEADKDTGKANEDEKVEESKLTLEEVYEKALERQNELESMSANVEMEQEMTYESADGDSFDASSTMSMKMDMILDPMAMYMKGTIGFTDMETGESEDLETEMYMAEDGFYMYEPESKQWLKMPVENYEEIMGSASTTVNAAEQLEELKAFVKDFKLEETDKYYVLKMEAAGDDFKQYLMDQMEANTGIEFTEEDQEVIEGLDFDKLSYVINVNKETFDIDSMDMVVELVTEIDGEKMTIAVDSKMEFTNFNGVESITVPQEVLDHALDISNLQ